MKNINNQVPELVKISNIHWDTEDNGETVSQESLGLPDEYIVSTSNFIEEGEEFDEEGVSEDAIDWLSDTFGYCIEGCKVQFLNTSDLVNEGEGFVGMLQLGEAVDITDPCYNRDVWCRMNDVKVVPGNYRCYAVVSDCGDWGKRVSSMRIVHESWGSDRAGFIVDYVGEIGVDAGLAGFFNQKPDYSDEEWAELCGKIHDIWPTVYLEDKMFVCSSGFGDGGYGVYGHHVGDRYDMLEIEFISEDEMDDDEPEED